MSDSVSDEVLYGVVSVQDVNSVEDAAGFVAGKLVAQGTPSVKAFDPAMIMLIIQILKLIVDNCPLFKKSAKDVVDTAKKPGILQRWAVQRQVKSAIFSQDGVSRPTKEEKEIWQEHGDKLVEAIFKAGADATPETIQKLIDSVK